METRLHTAPRDALFDSSDIIRATADVTLRADQTLVYVAGKAAADVTITLPSVEEAAGRTYGIHVQSIGVGSDDIVVAFPNGLTNVPGDIILTSAGDWVLVGSNGFNYRILAASFDKRVYKFALNITGTSGGLGGALQNPEPYKQIIHEVVLNITTQDTGGNGKVNIGIGSSATADSDVLMDEISTVVDTLCMSISQGTNGDPAIWDEKGGTNDWVTVSQDASNTIAGAAGFVYIHTHKL